MEAQGQTTHSKSLTLLGQAGLRRAEAAEMDDALSLPGSPLLLPACTSPRLTDPGAYQMVLTVTWTHMFLFELGF